MTKIKNLMTQSDDDVENLDFPTDGENTKWHNCFGKV